RGLRALGRPRPAAVLRPGAGGAAHAGRRLAAQVGAQLAKWGHIRAGARQAGGPRAAARSAQLASIGARGARGARRLRPSKAESASPLGEIRPVLLVLVAVVRVPARLLPAGCAIAGGCPRPSLARSGRA